MGALTLLFFSPFFLVFRVSVFLVFLALVYVSRALLQCRMHRAVCLSVFLTKACRGEVRYS